MRPATPSECPGFLVFDTWVTRNRHGRACPGHDDVGTDALEAPAGIAAAAEHERRSGAAASHPYCQ